MRARAVGCALVVLCGCAALAERPSKNLEHEPSAAGAGAAVDEGGGESRPGTGTVTSREAVLTFAQASCLELDQPACAGCHRREQGFVLRPVGVPPPPPNTPTVAREECLQPLAMSAPDAGAAMPPAEPSTTPDTPIDPAVEHVLSSEQAVCIGVDQPVCAGCHRRQGSFLLSPRGLPAHPGTTTMLLERCL